MTTVQKRLLIVRRCCGILLIFIGRMRWTTRMSRDDIATESYFLLLFLLPAMAANAIPVLLRHLPFFGQPIAATVFGKNKTRRGFLGAVLTGILVCRGMHAIGLIGPTFLAHFTLAWFPFPLDPRAYMLIGFSLGLGAISGDLIKSYIKRRHEIPSGESFIPWDQIDYIIGAGIATVWCYPRTLSGLVVACLYGGIISFLAHLSAYCCKLIDTNK